MAFHCAGIQQHFAYFIMFQFDPWVFEQFHGTMIYFFRYFMFIHVSVS